MNVLITCAGRRSQLVGHFREAVAPLGGRVIAANSERLASGLQAADGAYLVPGIAEPGYLPRLLEIVRAERIRLVLSLFDLDLPVLAGARAAFARDGAVVAVADPAAVAIANDKWRMFRALTAAGIPTPMTWPDADAALAAVAAATACFPMVVKPRFGMGSIGVFRAADPAELRAFVAACRRTVAETHLALASKVPPERAVLVQEAVPGPEYGIDVLNNLDGRPLAVEVRRKLAMRAGETDAAVTEEAPAVAALGARLGAWLGHRGNLDVDVVSPPGGAPVVLDLNARFGGGYPFSHLAGARFPRALVQMALGETPDPGRAAPGVEGFRDTAVLGVAPGMPALPRSPAPSGT